MLFIGSYSGYLFWKKSASEQKLKQVEISLTEYQNEMVKYEAKDVLGAINAKKTLADLENDIIKWSKIIKKIRKTLPKEDGLTLIDILSYSGSSGNEISMNVRTFPERDEPYFDVADLIEAFDDSQFFVDGFVPSISSGIDEEGSEILTFLFGVRYVEEDTLESSDEEGIERDSDDEDVEDEVVVEDEVEAEISDDDSDEEGDVVEEPVVD